VSGDGITARYDLPRDEFSETWDAIKLPAGVKDRLLCQSLLCLTVRQKLSIDTAPLHGFILLIGPAGTGKTTLARGLANEVGRRVSGKKVFVQVNPHALAKAALGSSQNAVTKLFESTLPEAAIGGIAIILLDEIETLAPARQRLSLEANPIDVHRASDAVLTGLDDLGREHKNLLLIGTSNFPKALDPALISRADLVQEIGLPDEEARREIILDTLLGIAATWREVARLSDSASELAKVAAGLDGRAIRKAIFAGAALDIETAQNLNRMTVAQIKTALLHAVDAQKKATEA
jgi:SpoVK/Ycf46/Vps4 family AAA+-type ATPase